MNIRTFTAPQLKVIKTVNTMFVFHGIKDKKPYMHKVSKKGDSWVWSLNKNKWHKHQQIDSDRAKLMIDDTPEEKQKHYLMLDPDYATYNSFNLSCAACTKEKLKKDKKSKPVYHNIAEFSKNNANKNRPFNSSCKEKVYARIPPYKKVKQRSETNKTMKVVTNWLTETPEFLHKTVKEKKPVSINSLRIF